MNKFSIKPHPKEGYYVVHGSDILEEVYLPTDAFVWDAQLGYWKHPKEVDRIELFKYYALPNNFKVKVKIPAISGPGSLYATLGSEVRLEKGSVYQDLEHGEYFVCINADVDSQGDCHVLNFDGTDGFALSECQSYLKLANTLSEFIFTQKELSYGTPT